jgi:hypothetical protein
VLTLPAKVIKKSTSNVQVSYTVTATDLLTPTPVVQCTPASGTVFTTDRITTVDCTATDAAGNTASGSFEVVVGESFLVLAATHSLKALKHDMPCKSCNEA